MTRSLPVFKALADESRLRILRVLEVAGFNVGELCEILGMGQSRTSRHLKILADAGLVVARREGSRVYYSLPRARVDDLRGRVLRAVALEDPPTEDRGRAREVEALRERRTEAFFAEVAPRWDSLRRKSLGDLEYLPSFLDEVPGAEVVVDLGTGTGDLALSLAPRVGKAIGVDRSENMLAEAERRRADEGRGNVEFRLGALEHLPLRDGEAAAAVAHMVLHYVADPAMVLQEVSRALEPGGTLHIADLARHEHEWMRDELEHRWLGFDSDELTTWLAEAGFTDVRTRTLARPGGAPDVVLCAGTRT